MNGLEGVYVFPLPEDSAVDQLRMYIDDRVIEGQIHEKKEAKKIYEKAKKEGKSASLVEQQRPNIFTTSVANIAPGGTIIVAIEYQQAVLIDNNNLFNSDFRWLSVTGIFQELRLKLLH